jgi:transcriptional regulator with XRE-family HTH domain
VLNYKKQEYLEDIMDYRERLRNIREDRDLTQAELGKVLNKSQQGYNHIETGRAELKIDDLVALCRFYDLSADYIIGLVDKQTSYKRK